MSETPIRNIIHGILEDGDGKLYLSTNSGLLRYDPATHSQTRYSYSYGINTVEYSDGAAWKDPASGQLFFGGTNGFVVMEQTRYKSEPFYPDLLFRYVRINDRLIPFDEAVTRDSILTVRPHERLYDLGVIALDYINGSNYVYLYHIEGMENRWLESSSDLQFAERHPGRYRLNVRYKNVVTGDMGPVRSVPEETGRDIGAHRGQTQGGDSRLEASSDGESGAADSRSGLHAFGAVPADTRLCAVG